ncbi:guanine deaminase isoform X2 [Bombyx mandarina]|uniref:Guanine deaminase n=1 Tax=Bombyx mandarina TaxID=7092 RepID=A0A6J2KDC6_BOMMA|nr:guanine deaminase isoform X1 [Bombyx mandarina]XP_028038918.1 guanine deaminase isoform X2 [Bombyx mandarina]
MTRKHTFVGAYAHSDNKRQLSVCFGFLTIENGKITQKGSIEEFEELLSSGKFSEHIVINLSDSQLIIPGFIDCHIHAPQFPNIGLGLDRPLLEWLDKYTFPLEKKYSDTVFASKVYDQVVQRLLKNGTTTACYFGSLHLDGTLELVKSVLKYHQRAFVGKVSMNLQNDAGYYNSTEKELQDAEEFVQKVLDYKNELIQPVVTPRFAVSCDHQLLSGLAMIANKYGCSMQSHVCENLKEINYVLEINPRCKSYCEVYDKSKILHEKCIMAHAVHLTDEEIDLLSKKRVSIAHCPASNTRLKSGLCPVRKLLDNNIIVGLGTDVSGGDSATILDAVRRTMDVSTCLELQGADNYSLDWKEAFYLATLGGAKALNLDDKIGNFEVGKDFDALLIDAYAPDGPIDEYEYSVDENKEEHAVSLLQRFIYLGDDRNILQVYVKGKSVKTI